MARLIERGDWTPGMVDILEEYERVRAEGRDPQPALAEAMRDEIIELRAKLANEQRLSEALNSESNKRGASVERLARSVELLSGLDEAEEV